MEVVCLILSGLGSVGGVLWLREKYRQYVRDRAFRKFFPDDEEVLIVCPTQGGAAPSPNVPTTFEDSLAQATIQTAFTQYGKRHRVKLHTHVTDDERAQTLFLICGIVGNSVTKALQDTGLMPYRFEHDKDGQWAITNTSGQQLHAPVYPPDRDYAVLGIVRNPWAPAHNPSRVYFAAGIHGLGTWAAATQFVARPGELADRLRANSVSPDGGFAAILSAERVGVHPPSTSVSPATTTAL